MTEEFAPRRRSDKVLEIDPTGYLMPCYEDRQPVLLRMPQTDVKRLPVFSSREKLAIGMREGGANEIQFDRIVEITDGREFLSGLPPWVKVALDLHVNEQGRSNWGEVL